MLRLFCIVFLSQLVAPAQSLRVLMYQLALSKSHMQFSGRLADLLVNHNYTVDKLIMAWNPMMQYNGTNKVRKVMWVTSNEPNSFAKSAHMTDPFSEFEFDQNILLQARLGVCQSLLENDALLAQLIENKYDVALGAPFDFCSHGLFHLLGIQRILSFSALPLATSMPRIMGVPILPSYVTESLTHAGNYDMDFWGRIYNIYNLAKSFHRDTVALRAEQALFDRKYGEHFPQLSELAKRVSLYFLNNNELIHMPRALSPQFVYIGGIGTHAEASDLPQKYVRLLKQYPAGAVVISFGSYVHSSVFRPELRDTFLRTTRAFPEYLFLWKFENHSHEEGVFRGFPNVYPVEWLPQQELFASGRVRAFISHMGLNSYLEAIRHAVPMIAVPLFADQPFNTETAVRKGMAVHVPKTAITLERLQTALTAVLSNPKYRERIALYAKKMTLQPFTPEELFLRNFAHASQFDDLWQDRLLQSANQSWIEYLCLDVALAFAVTLSVAIWVLVRVFSTLTTPNDFPSSRATTKSKRGRRK